MSGPETDATILFLLRGPGPCPICKSELPEWCIHKKRARFAVQGTDGPECDACGSVIDIRQDHECTSAHDHGDAYAEGERIGQRKGRELSERAIAAWLRHMATDRKCSATKAHAYRDIAARIERREHDS